MLTECHQCQKTADDTVLRACKVCRKQFCEDHAVTRSGVAFCSLGCGQFFFHAEPDAEDEDC